MKQMTVKEVETLLNEGKNLNIIDVREVDEVAAGKIPGALNMPLRLVEFRMHLASAKGRKNGLLW